MIVTRHKDELITDGYSTQKRDYLIQVLNLQKEDLKSYRGKTVAKLNNGSELIIPNRGLRVFPKRAILRVGMLLRDSNVAKEVRTQLLNVVETATEELPKEKLTAKLDKETQLIVNIIQAKDDESKIFAFRDYKIFKDQTIDLLRGHIDTWQPKELVRRIVNKLSNGYNYGQIWNQLYKDLHYRYQIQVRSRKKPSDKSLLDTLSKDELAKLVRVAVSKSIKENVDISDVLEHKPSDLKVEMK